MAQCFQPPHPQSSITVRFSPQVGKSTFFCFDACRGRCDFTPTFCICLESRISRSSQSQITQHRCSLFQGFPISRLRTALQKADRPISLRFGNPPRIALWLPAVPGSKLQLTYLMAQKKNFLSQGLATGHAPVQPTGSIRFWSGAACIYTRETPS